jgi:hypothetical protein
VGESSRAITCSETGLTMVDSMNAAGLILKLYELRTEPKLRSARAWFAFEFHPQSAKEILGTWLGPGHESAPYRMVTTSSDDRLGIFQRYLERQRGIAAEGKQRPNLTA